MVRAARRSAAPSAECKTQSVLLSGINHVEAASAEVFDEVRTRLLARGATDGFVTDFGPILSLFFRDPDGLEAEVCVTNPDARPGVHNPPGTPARRYHAAGTPPPERLQSSPLGAP